MRVGGTRTGANREAGDLTPDRTARGVRNSEVERLATSWRLLPRTSASSAFHVKIMPFRPKTCLNACRTMFP